MVKSKDYLQFIHYLFKVCDYANFDVLDFVLLKLSKSKGRKMIEILVQMCRYMRLILHIYFPVAFQQCMIDKGSIQICARSIFILHI